MGISATRSGGLASPTPIDRLVEERRMENIFAFCIAERTGLLVFGGRVRPERAEHVHWVPMREQKFYALALNDIRIGGRSFGARGGVGAAGGARAGGWRARAAVVRPRPVVRARRGRRSGAAVFEAAHSTRVRGARRRAARSGAAAPRPAAPTTRAPTRARARLLRPPRASPPGVDRRRYVSTIIDTGTTFLYLPPDAYRRLRASFTSGCPWGACAARKHKTRYNDEFCYAMSPAERDKFAEMTLHFDGSPAPLALSPLEYTYEIRVRPAPPEGRAVRCLAAFDNKHNGVVLGAAVLRNREVILDRAHRRVGFVRADCARVQPRASILTNNTFLSDRCGHATPLDARPGLLRRARGRRRALAGAARERGGRERGAGTAPWNATAAAHGRPDASEPGGDS